MMMMPFVRLLAIYALVGAAIFAFLKRDELMAYLSADSEVEIVADAEAAPTPAPEPEPEPEASDDSVVIETTPELTTPLPNYSSAPAFGSEITPQYFGQAPAPSAAETPAPAQSGGNMVERWRKAREVFNQGNITEAARLYEDLTASFPDSADLHGEAGNLYYNLGQFAKAATHYFAVGEISVRTGNAAMATSMQNLLRRIAPAKASELQAIITAAR